MISTLYNSSLRLWFTTGLPTSLRNMHERSPRFNRLAQRVPMIVSRVSKFTQSRAISTHTYNLSSVAGLLDVSEKDGIRTITMIDEKTRNSLSQEMLKGLEAALIAEDPTLRCVLLKARGHVFSAGHNLKHILAGDASTHASLFVACTRLMTAISSAPVPVVAAVDGVAAAAGCQLVAACDIVVASDTSAFSTPGAAAGIFCHTPGVPLVRCVPNKVAALMLYTGRPITAQEALRAGLVSVVVPKQELDNEVERVLSGITSKSRAVVAMGKRFLHQQVNLTEDEAYRLGSDVMVENINTRDGQEGIRAFVEKRRPQWTHDQA